MFSSLLDRLGSLRHRIGGGAADSSAGFGTFQGVVVPTVLTILGAIMYLREGWVVGNAGLGGAVLIILLAHIITVTTALSVSSIATNIRVGSGGAFSIISQSLGLEIGGSVGVPLYLAQAVSITLYVLAFTEGWQRIFPNHPFGVVAVVALAVVFVIAYVSAELASRTQVLVLLIVLFSLVSIGLGAVPISGQAGFAHDPVLWGDFPSGDFFTVFAVFFPAITGIMVGINLSGTLADPRESIPRGTLSSIAFTLVVYLLLAYWLSRVATPEELVQNTTIMVDRAYWPWAVLAGLLGATFSSALGSLVAAPRVMQALARYKVIPFSDFFSRQSEAGEPRPAMAATGLIALVALLAALAAGGLNAIAPLITMFFLLTYAMLNGVVALEQTMDMVSFRPTFRISRIIPLIGLVFCLFVMFLVSPGFSVVAIVLSLFVYGFLLRRHLEAPFSDVRSGLFMAVAEWSAKHLSTLPEAPERTWRPNILSPVTSTGLLRGSYRFLNSVTRPRGAVFVLGIFRRGERERVEGLRDLSDAFNNDDIFSRTTFVQSESFVEGVLAAMEVLRGVLFPPNLLFLPLEEDLDVEKVTAILEDPAAREMGILLLARHPVVELGREQAISVWISPRGPEWELGLRLTNLDLLVLLAYQLQVNWEGVITLCMAVDDEATREEAVAFLQRLIRLARLPKNTEIRVEVGTFKEVLAAAPTADLNLFGLASEQDVALVHQTMNIVEASCLFVRDSGDESALA